MGGLFIKNKCKKMLKLTNTNEKKFKKNSGVVKNGCKWLKNNV